MTRPPALAAAILSLALVAGPVRAEGTAPVNLRILAINDFHGYLRPPPGGIRISDPADHAKKVVVPAGGAERMATIVKQLRSCEQHLRRGRRSDRREPVPVGDVP